MGTKSKQTPLLTKEQVSELLLQQYLRVWKSNHTYIVENLYVFDWESDMLIKTRSGYWYEVECKISLADFKNDFKNKRQKHELLKTWDEKHRRPNYFYYCVPWYLSEKVLPLLPDYAGLIVLTENGRLNEVNRAPCLHKQKYTNEELKLCDKFYYAYRNWKENVERHQPTEAIKRLKDEIAFLKAEYKAVAGCDIKDAF
nr:MAG TPA: DNA repair protein MmcB-like protein [Caudoviricetes sp.]